MITPVVHRDIHTSVPQFSSHAQSVHTIFPCPLPSYPLQGFCLPLIFPPCGSADSNFHMAKTFSSFFTKDFMGVFYIFLLIPRIQAPPTSFPPYFQDWVHTYSLIIVMAFFSVWARNYSRCGCVPAVLKEQTERKDGRCYLGRY